MDIIFWTGMFSDLSRPIGCYQLAHWLRKHSYDCQVIDFVHRMTPEEIFTFTSKFITDKTLCIGISSTFWSVIVHNRQRRTTQMPEVLYQAMKLIQASYPKIKFILGGNQVDHQAKETINQFDLVVSGAGEDILLEYLEELRKNKKQIFSLETRYGTPYRAGSLNNKFDIQTNDHLFAEQDCIIDGETLPIEISRGCIFKCAYCQYPYIGKKKLDYVRHIDLIKNEIEYNYKTFKTKNYFILDDTFNDTPEKVDIWLDCVESLDFDIEYTSYMRADLLSRNEYQIERFQKSGLAGVFFGIESFHPEVSRMIGKGWSGKEGKTFLSELKQQWMNTVNIHLSFIVGFHQETDEDYRNTQRWCTENKMDSWIWQSLYINPTPRLFISELERNPEKFGITVKKRRDVSGIWYNKTRTETSSHFLASRLNEERIELKNQKVSNWRMLYLMTMGFTSEFLKNHYDHEIDQNLLAFRESIFLSRYKEKLKKLTV